MPDLVGNPGNHLFCDETYLVQDRLSPNLAAEFLHPKKFI